MSGYFNREFLKPGFLLENTKRRFLIADCEVASIADIDVNDLKDRGIKAVIFDVDNTLCEHRGTKVDVKIEAVLDDLKNTFKCCILSNTRDDDRLRDLEGFFKMPVVYNKDKKPDVRAFNQALKLLGTGPGQTAMVGDRAMTDIAGANKVGMYSIKVKPVSFLSEPALLIAARVFEDALLMFYKIVG